MCPDLWNLTTTCRDSKTLQALRVLEGRVSGKRDSDMQDDSARCCWRMRMRAVISACWRSSHMETQNVSALVVCPFECCTLRQVSSCVFLARVLCRTVSSSHIPSKLLARYVNCAVSITVFHAPISARVVNGCRKTAFAMTDSPV